MVSAKSTQFHIETTPEMPSFTAAQVAERNAKGGKDCWVIYKDNVYDLTKYLEKHPGGADLITDWAGKDCTQAFQDAGHSFLAVIVLKTYKIGTLENDDAVTGGRIEDKKVDSKGVKSKKHCCILERLKRIRGAALG